ncbi:TIGR03752 family integrating conjugative element protein [Pseudomonas sp. NPDC088368]|uniref:TIGR03752 family integrating conjugative element protein n=1 Tax=Pseudomonas sp. NPDC088368 TaxID=3364453 RepID=UPI003804FBFA
MAGNPLLKFLVLPAVVLAILIGVKVFSNKPADAVQQAQTPKLTPEEAKALGVEGDTPSDTLRTMVAESRELKDQISKVISDNKAQKQENDALKTQLGNINQTMDQRIKAAQDQMKEDTQVQQQGMAEQLKQQFTNLSQIGKNNSGSDMPIGLGVQASDGADLKKSGDGPEIVWVNPQDATAIDATGKPLPAGSGQTPTGFNFPSSFGDSIDRGQKALSTGAQQVNETVSGPQEARKKVRRVYTLPQNSTLMGSVAMSALIGRVPVDGTVNDPYPFKVLIGPDNLTANGIDLPDVAGAVASGTASGDWTLSCVRGQIRSMTFVFTDGTVRTLPAPSKDGQQNNSNQNQSQSTNGQPQPVQGGMGWISDPYGIPCISGERRSNATQYIGSQALITAAGAGAASLIKTDNTTSSFVTGANGTLGATGVSGNQAMGQILNQGVSDISSWVNKLYGQAFAAVYVEPGAKVVLHLDQELDIDYEIKGRKVNYGTGAQHAAANLD